MRSHDLWQTPNPLFCVLPDVDRWPWPLFNLVCSAPRFPIESVRPLWWSTRRIGWSALRTFPQLRRQTRAKAPKLLSSSTTTRRRKRRCFWTRQLSPITNFTKNLQVLEEAIKEEDSFLEYVKTLKIEVRSRLLYKTDHLLSPESGRSNCWFKNYA